MEQKKFYLISWDDDNHGKAYWLETTFLGWESEIRTVIENFAKLDIPKGSKICEFDITGDCFPEDIWEQLFDYFQTIPKLDQADVRLIVSEKWKCFYTKNIKKIMRKQGLTK